MYWTIKDAASLTGLSENTLRYYENLHIIFPQRQPNGYRYYTEQDILVLKYVYVMKHLKMSLEEIRLAVKVLYDSPSLECEKIANQLITSKITQLKKQISEYKSAISALEHVYPMLSTMDNYIKNTENLNKWVVSRHEYLVNLNKVTS